MASNFNEYLELTVGLESYEDYIARARKIHAQGDMQTLGNFLIAFRSRFSILYEMAFWRNGKIASYDFEDNHEGDFTVEEFYNRHIPLYDLTYEDGYEDDED